jgi:hypothetical protein
MRYTAKENVNAKSFNGSIEFVIRDRSGRVLKQWTEENIVKIFAKEILSHRMHHTRVWDPTGGTGSGAWVDSGIDPSGEFAAKYILLGASFDENGIPLDSNDPRYYTTDPVTNKPVPIRLDVGAFYDGELINAIPLADPSRPLKKVERIAFEPTYQPSGTPFLLPEVRAMNNVVLLETIIKADEYNGFGAGGSSSSAGSELGSDFFTLTEVALAGGREIDFLPRCEIRPKELFLEGVNGPGSNSIPAMASGGDVVSIVDPANFSKIKEGDQIKIVVAGGSADAGLEGSAADILDQINPHYLVVSKLPSGSDLQLDRVPVNKDNVPITGPIGVLRNTLRIFSHRILKVPIKKSPDIELLVRWRITFA